MGKRGKIGSVGGWEGGRGEWKGEGGKMGGGWDGRGGQLGQVEDPDV